MARCYNICDDEYFEIYSVLANIRHPYRRNLIKEFGPKTLISQQFLYQKKKEK